MSENGTVEIKENKGIDRRNFLKLAGYSTLGSAAALHLGNPSDAKACSSPPPSCGGSGFWNWVQRRFVLDPDKVYMNIGTTGSMPRHVLRNYDRYNHIVAEDPWHMKGEWGDFPYVSELIAAIAPQFGCDTDELVLSRNTTDGMCTILGGLDLNEGDRILTTHHEHIAALSPLMILADRRGVQVEYLEIPVFPTCEEDYLQVFADAIAAGPKPKLIVFSHITYKSGARLPAARICNELAVPNGIATFIDGAHAPGMLNLDFHAINCDFYSGSGHKWQCGPGATGLLYIRDETNRVKEFWGQEQVYWPINASLYPAAGAFNLATQLQYVGNDNYPAKRALADSCEFWSQIGRDRIEEYVLSLSAYCKQKIRQSFGDAAVLYSPDVPELSSGITSFNPFPDQSDFDSILTFRDRLREEYDFIIRYTDFKIHNDDANNTYAMRISTHLFHDFRQVRQLVDAMYDLYRDMV